MKKIALIQASDCVVVYPDFHLGGFFNKVMVFITEKTNLHGRTCPV